MKKNILLVAAILALSTATYAAPDTKTKPVEVKTTVVDTKAADVKTTTVKAVEVKVEPKVIVSQPLETKQDKSKVFSNFTGTIEYKSDLFGTESGKNSGNRTTTTVVTTGGTTTTTTEQGVIKTTEKSNSFLDLDKDGEENKASVDLGAKVFDAYDLKLSLKAVHDKNEQVGETVNPTTPTKEAQEATTFAISRTWADAYVEWKSEVDLDGGTLFNALVQESSITVRKNIGKVEGQIKAKSMLDDSGRGKYGIDITSLDTYIKVMPTPTLNVTFRPYDIDWQTGKEFKNNNLNRTYELATVDTSVPATYTSTDLIKSFNNKVAKVETPKSGIEADYTKGKMKYFGKFNTEALKSITTEKVTLGTGVNDKDKVIEKVTTTTTPRNVITYLLGVEFKMNEDTKLVATTMLDNKRKSTNPEARTTETTTYTTPTTSTTTVTENKDEQSKNYLTFNIFGETKLAGLKFEAELDYRNETDSTKTTTNNGTTNSTTNLELSRNMFGIFGKATFEKLKMFTPYISTKYITKSVKRENNGSVVTLATGVSVPSQAVDYNESYNKFDFTVGAEKKYEALTIGTEFTVSNAGYGERKQTTTTTVTTTDVSAEKVDLGVNTLASFKVAYKF